VEGRDETWPPGGIGRPGRPGSPPEEHRAGTQRRADAGVAGNARLTAANAAVLLVLLAAEGVTILRVHQLLSPHVFIGVVLIPPVLLKVASTTWRFARYYTGVPAYRRKGAPPVLLRMLGPIVVILTLVLLFSGVGLRRSTRISLAQSRGPLAISSTGRTSVASGRHTSTIRLNVRPDAADDAGLGDDRLEDHLGESRFTQDRLPELR
jgi:hypothetical protein